MNGFQEVRRCARLSKLIVSDLELQCDYWIIAYISSEERFANPTGTIPGHGSTRYNDLSRSNLVESAFGNDSRVGVGIIARVEQ